jgi:outer membrane biosynthesis protein TonB
VSPTYRRARRRFWIAVVLSALLHALLFAIPMRKRVLDTLGGAEGPFQVTIVEAEPPAPQSEPQAPAIPEPPSAVPPPPSPPPVLTARERAPRKAAPPPAVEPAPPVRVPPQPPPPQADMLAMIEARRAQRRAADAAAARGSAPQAAPSEGDPTLASINRNLQTLGPGTEGVGGVFQILRKSSLSAEFAFNGWRPESRKQWREVIEVSAGPDGDIERAIVRRMIALIRSHYTGDFNWNSHRLGRVVVLSARPEDNEGLEEYLIREFFGTPTLAPGNGPSK